MFLSHELDPFTPRPHCTVCIPPRCSGHKAGLPLGRCCGNCWCSTGSGAESYPGRWGGRSDWRCLRPLSRGSWGSHPCSAHAAVCLGCGVARVRSSGDSTQHTYRAWPFQWCPLPASRSQTCPIQCLSFQSPPPSENIKSTRGIIKIILVQCCPIELSRMTEMFYSARPDMIASKYIKLLSIWNVAVRLRNWVKILILVTVIPQYSQGIGCKTSPFPTADTKIRGCSSALHKMAWCSRPSVSTNVESVDTEGQLQIK